MLRNLKQWITLGLYSDSSAEPATSDKQKAKNKKRILKNEKNELKKIGHTLIFVDAIQNKLGEKSLFSTKRHGLDVLQEFLQKTLVGGNKKDEETGFRNIQRNLSEVGTGKEFVIEIGGQTVERSREEIELHLLLNSNIKAIAEKSQGSNFIYQAPEVGDNWIGDGSRPTRSGPLPLDLVHGRSQLPDWPNPGAQGHPPAQTQLQSKSHSRSQSTAPLARRAQRGTHDPAFHNSVQTAEYSDDRVEMPEVDRLWHYTHLEKTVSSDEGNAWLRSAWLAALSQLTPEQLEATLTEKLKGTLKIDRGMAYIPVVVELARMVQNEGIDHLNHEDFDKALADAHKAMCNLTFEIINLKDKNDYKNTVRNLESSEPSFATRRATLDGERILQRKTLFDAINRADESGTQRHIETLLKELGVDVVIAEKSDRYIDKIKVVAQPDSVLNGLPMDAGKNTNTHTLKTALRSKAIIGCSNGEFSVRVPRTPERPMRQACNANSARAQRNSPQNQSDGQRTEVRPQHNGGEQVHRTYSSSRIPMSFLTKQKLEEESHELINMSGDFCNCWLRAGWMSALIQCDPNTLATKLTAALGNRLQLTRENLEAEAAIDEVSTHDIPSRGEDASEKERRLRLERKLRIDFAKSGNGEQLARSIDHVVLLARSIKENGFERYLTPAEPGNLRTFKLPDEIEGHLKNITYSVLQNKRQIEKELLLSSATQAEPDALLGNLSLAGIDPPNLTTSVLGGRFGDDKEIKVLLSALGFDTMLLSFGRNERPSENNAAPNFLHTWTNESMPLLEEFDLKSIGPVARQRREENGKTLGQALYGRPLLVHLAGGHFQLYRPVSRRPVLSSTNQPNPRKNGSAPLRNEQRRANFSHSTQMHDKNSKVRTDFQATANTPVDSTTPPPAGVRTVPLDTDQFTFQTYGPMEINFQEFSKTKMNHHSLVDMSGENNKCWMRAGWFSAFEQCDPSLLKAKLDVLLRDRINMGTDEYIREARIPEKSTDRYGDTPDEVRLKNEEQLRKNLAVENPGYSLQDAIDHVARLATNFKNRRNIHRESNESFQFSFSKEDEAHLKQVTYAILRKYASEIPEVNITATVLGGVIGDARAIRILLSALGLETVILKAPPYTNQLENIVQPDVASLDPTDSNLPGLILMTKNAIAIPRSFEPNTTNVDENTKGIKRLTRGLPIVVFIPERVHFSLYKSI